MIVDAKIINTVVNNQKYYHNSRSINNTQESLLNTQVNDTDFVNNNPKIPSKRKIKKILYQNDKKIKSSRFREQMDEILQESANYWRKNPTTFGNIDPSTLTENCRNK